MGDSRPPYFLAAVLTFDEFRIFVESNIDWFHGRLPETESSLQCVEQALGASLPPSLKWLLVTHGYWHGTGVSNLKATVRDTLDFRQVLALPQNFVVLENFQDGGVVLIDTTELTSSGESPLYWIAPEDVGDPPRLEANTRFDSFGEYVKHRLPSVQDFIEPQHIRYDPADFPEGRGDDKRVPLLERPQEPPPRDIPPKR